MNSQKQSVRRTIGMIVCMLPVMLLSGCGRWQEARETQSEALWEGECFFEVQQAVFIEDRNVIEAVTAQNSLYYCVPDDSIFNGTVFCRRDYETGETEEIEIPMPERHTVYHMGIGQDGSIYVLYVSGRDGEQEYLLEKYDKTGKRLLSNELTTLLGAEGFQYLACFEVNAAGQCVITEDRDILVLDENGNFLNHFAVDDTITATGRGTNGNVIVQYHSSVGYQLLEIDTLGSRAQEYTVSNCAIGEHSITALDERRLGIATQYGYEEYNIETGVITERIQWSLYGINGETVRYAAAFDNGNVIAYCYSDTYQQDFALEKYFTRTAEDQ